MTDMELRDAFLAIFCALPGRAEELGGIYAKEGVDGARVALEGITIEMANEVAALLDDLTCHLQSKMSDEPERLPVKLSAPKFH